MREIGPSPGAGIVGTITNFISPRGAPAARERKQSAALSQLSKGLHGVWSNAAISKCLLPNLVRNRVVLIASDGLFRPSQTAWPTCAPPARDIASPVDGHVSALGRIRLPVFAAGVRRAWTFLGRRGEGGRERVGQAVGILGRNGLDQIGLGQRHGALIGRVTPKRRPDRRQSDPSPRRQAPIGQLPSSLDVRWRSRHR